MIRQRAKLIGSRRIVFCALFVAMLAVLSQIAIPLPFSPVPFSLGLLAVLLCGCFLGPLWGTVSVGVYILLGVVGLPVFAGFRSVEAVVGPTGGYILGYVFAVIISGIFSRRATNGLKGRSWFFAGLILAIFACYVPGVLWTSFQQKAKILPTLVAALAFLPFDLLKAALAMLLTIKINKIYKL